MFQQHQQNFTLLQQQQLALASYGVLDGTAAAQWASVQPLGQLFTNSECKEQITINSADSNKEEINGTVNKINKQSPTISIGAGMNIGENAVSKT